MINSKKILYIILKMLAITLLLSLVFYIGFICFLLFPHCSVKYWSNENFEKEKWHVGGIDNRYKYVNSLLSKDMNGISYSEAKKLLGKPDYESSKLSYVFYNIALSRSIREECNLFDAISLELKLDSGHVKSVEIVYD